MDTPTPPLHPNSPGPLAMDLPWEFPLEGDYWKPRVQACSNTEPHERHSWTDDTPRISKGRGWLFYNQWNCEGIIDPVPIRLRLARQLSVEYNELIMARRDFGAKERRGSNLQQHILDRMKEIKEEMTQLAQASGMPAPTPEPDEEPEDDDGWG